MKKTEDTVSAIYMAQTQHECVKLGQQTYEEGREIILKFMNHGLPPGEYHNMMDYFKDGVADHSDIMKDPDILSESKRQAWDALDYFDLI